MSPREPDDPAARPRRKGGRFKTISIDTGQGRRGSYDHNRAHFLSFVATRRDFLAGSDSPSALLERCLGVIARREAEVQAFAWLNEAGARAAAEAATERYRAGRPLSPIDGCPIAVKDSIETADMPMQMNSPVFKGWVPVRDAACVFALRKCGAVILGKTVTPELVLGVSGPTRNPFDPERTPGGSSSGSAAAVGAGMVPVAIGNQTGGSLIRPSSYCANYGFKPTHGALNIGGMHPIAPSQDHIGPMAGTLADAWLTAQQISYHAGGTGDHPGLTGRPELPEAAAPRRLIRLRTGGWPELDKGTVAAFERFLADLADAGVEVVDETTSPAVARLEEMLIDGNEVAYDIMMYEARWPTLAYAEGRPREALSEYLRKRLERGQRMTPDDFRRALARRDAIRRQVAEAARGTDGFVTLASSGPAPLGLTETGSRHFLSPWSMVGGPSFSLPLMAVDGLPVGVQLMGLPDTDERLTAIARWIDELYAA